MKELYYLCWILWQRCTSLGEVQAATAGDGQEGDRSKTVNKLPSKGQGKGVSLLSLDDKGKGQEIVDETLQEDLEQKIV